jgi:hypothetical protein
MVSGKHVRERLVTPASVFVEDGEGYRRLGPYHIDKSDMELNLVFRGNRFPVYVHSCRHYLANPIQAEMLCH